MSNLFWLSDEQMARLRPFFPKSHEVPRVDVQRVLSGIIYANRNGLRWLIEEYFRTLKSAGFKIENAKMSDPNVFMNFAALAALLQSRLPRCCAPVTILQVRQ